jgi:hypothetical protein
MFPSCTLVPLVVNDLANCTTRRTKNHEGFWPQAFSFVYLGVLGGERFSKLHLTLVRGLALASGILRDLLTTTRSVRRD